MPELPDAKSIVRAAVMHMYSEMQDPKAPAHIRMRAASELADNVERWLSTTEGGDAKDILASVERFTGKRSA